MLKDVSVGKVLQFLDNMNTCQWNLLNFECVETIS